MNDGVGKEEFDQRDFGGGVEATEEVGVVGLVERILLAQPLSSLVRPTIYAGPTSGSVLGREEETR